MADRLDPHVSGELALASLRQTKHLCPSAPRASPCVYNIRGPGAPGLLKDVNIQSYHDHSFVIGNFCFPFGHF